MPLCRDPFVAQMNSLGFNALRIPRSDYVPGMLLAIQRGSAPALVGALGQIFDYAHLPEPSEVAAGQFSGAATASYKTNIGLKLASDWLGFKPSDWSGAFSGAKRMNFRFTDLRLLSLPLATFSDALLTAEPGPQLLMIPDSRLFIISEALQAREFMILAEGSDSQAVSLASEMINPAVVKLDANVDTSRAESGLLVFRAAHHHTVGFKAFEVELAGGDFRLTPAATEAGLSHMTGHKPGYTPFLLGDFSM